MSTVRRVSNFLHALTLASTCYHLIFLFFFVAMQYKSTTYTNNQGTTSNIPTSIPTDLHVDLSTQPMEQRLARRKQIFCIFRLFRLPKIPFITCRNPSTATRRPGLDGTIELDDTGHLHAGNEDGDLISIGLDNVAQAALLLSTFATPLPLVGDIFDFVKEIATLCQEFRANTCVFRCIYIFLFLC